MEESGIMYEDLVGNDRAPEDRPGKDAVGKRRGVCSVYLTFPDEETASRIGRILLEEKLIACANIFPAARSLYRWNGEIQDEHEVVAIAKTVEAKLPALTDRVIELHPYDTCCLVALQAVAGNPRYLEWVASEVIGPLPE